MTAVWWWKWLGLSPPCAAPKWDPRKQALVGESASRVRISSRHSRERVRTAGVIVVAGRPTGSERGRGPSIGRGRGSDRVAGSSVGYFGLVWDKWDASPQDKMECVLCWSGVGPESPMGLGRGVRVRIRQPRQTAVCTVEISLNIARRRLDARLPD